MKMIVVSEKDWDKAWELFFAKIKLEKHKCPKDCQCIGGAAGDLERLVIYNGHELKQSLEE